MIKIDYNRDGLLDETGVAILKDRYMLQDEGSPQDAFARAALAFGDSIEHSQRIYDYASKLWFMFATPVLSNAPRTEFYMTVSGLVKKHIPLPGNPQPISCFLNTPADSTKGITEHVEETVYLSKAGGGVGSNWSDVRQLGGKSNGIVPHLGVMDRLMLAWNQAGTRRGSYAAYLDIGHPEIEEFMDIRKESGGDINRKTLNLHHAVSISDEFMKKVEAAERGEDDTWNLIDPHTKQVVSQVRARDLWIRLLNNRHETGEPYILFTDTANRSIPSFHRDRGLFINQSNLCSEITLPTNSDRTAVCCLSSVNLEKYDEWKDNEQFIPDLIRFLDNVLQYFIDNAPRAMRRAVASARAERSIGLGAMGFHSYLQSKGIPFECGIARSINRGVFKRIKEQAYEATLELAREKGACPDSSESDTAVRNSYLLAVAPNASSSIICGNTSPSIEPLRANAFTQKTLSGTHLHKNKYLKKVLQKYGKDTDDVWKSIAVSGGSVQHLDFLSEDERDCFKTAMELDQSWLVTHAADRQEYICQSQSLNLFFPAKISALEIHQVHMLAWRSGIKSLYYVRSMAGKRPDNISQKIERQVISRASGEEECFGCSG